MSPVLFDLIIIGLVLLSVALGFMRGFCKEVFTIFGWVAAIIATIYFAPVSFHIGERYIENPLFARLATSSAIFLGTLGICSVVSYFATKTLHASKLGFVDQTFGLIFGILRAIVLLGLAYLLFLFTFSKPETRPVFVQEARTRPFLEASSNWIQTLLPSTVSVNINIENNPLDNILKPKDEEEKDLPQSTSEIINLDEEMFQDE